MRPLFRPARWLGAILLLPLLTAGAAAQGWSEAARSFAGRTLTRAGKPNSISIQFTHRSSLETAEAQAMEKAITTAFRNAGVNITESARSVAAIQIAITSDVKGLLWVAEIRQGTQRLTVLQSVPFTATAPRSGGKSYLLSKSLIWSQREQILDVANWESEGAPRAMLVLGAAEIVLFREEGGKWMREAGGTLPPIRARDPRGRLTVRADRSFEAFLPGLRCSGVALNGVNANCVPSDDPWPIASGVNAFYNSARNHFTGATTIENSARSFTPYYSVAKLPAGIVAAGLDGQSSLFTAADQPAFRRPDWGSDIAALRSDCGTVLLAVTGKSDGDSPDKLTGYEVTASGATAASEELAFDGPVVALWNLADEKLLAVARNLKTETYEAYAITARCGY